METRKKNYRETLALLIDMGEGYAGDDFALRFQAGRYTPGEFWCRKTGDVMENCTMAVDNRHVLCTLPGVNADGTGGHGLRSGILSVEVLVWLNGEWTLVSRQDVVCEEPAADNEAEAEKYKIYLYDGESEWQGVSDMEAELIGPVLHGPQGPQGERGPQGPQGEKGPAGEASIISFEQDERGHLIMHYTSPGVPVDFVVNKEGHLIIDF